MMSALLLSGAIGLFGRPAAPPSWAAPMPVADGAELAQAASAALAATFPPASSTLVVAPVAKPTPEDTFSAGFERALQKRGFALAADQLAAPGSHAVRYSVSPLWNGYVVRMVVDGQESSRFFQRSPSGDRVADNVTAVREAG